MGCEISNLLQSNQVSHFQDNYKPILSSENQVVFKSTSIFQQYHFLHFLTRTSKSYTRVITHRKSNIQRIAKVYYKNQLNLQAAFRQIKALKILDHPNIVRLQEYYIDDINIYLIFEKIEGKQLFLELLSSQDQVKLKFPFIFKQLLLVIEYLHSIGYAHLNICSSSILVMKQNSDYVVKVVGFSQIFEFKQKRRTFNNDIMIRRTQRITNFCIAPQISLLRNIEKADIWMVGLLFLMVITGKSFGTKSQKQKITNVIEQWISQNPNQQQLIDLIKKMLDPIPAVRLTAKGCLQHPFIIRIEQNIYKWRVNLIYHFLKNFQPKTKLKKLFQMCLVNRISSSNQHTEIRTEFTNLDKNKDGLLQMQELVEGLLNCFLLNRQQANNYVMNIFQKFGKDKSGALSYSQFVLGTVRIDKIVTEKNLQNIFKEIDYNGDGFISQEEVKNMFYDAQFQDDSILPRQKMNFEEFKHFMLGVSKKNNWR